ncbi:MAG: hypothetical protein NUV47_00050 [Patescibacteria group bacterium]|nr:hypothetical protein [Patescibacteria group bacterium]
MSNEAIRITLNNRLIHLAVCGKHKNAIKILRPLIKKTSDTDLLLKLAFMLYHNALKHFWKKNVSKKRKKEVKLQIDEAIHICKKIILRETRKKIISKDIISARIFLGQIYTAIGNNKDAIKIAKQNFKDQPNALTANRMADVYLRLDKYIEAGKWYKKYAEIAKKEKIPSYFIATDMAVFNFTIGNAVLGKKFANEALTNIPKNEIGLSLKKIIKSYLK